jgi:Na+-transporting NADH:ubiquinone oxidoreductase subunit B
VDVNNVAYASTSDSWLQAFIGFIPGSIGETSALACLIGALILIVTGVGSWRIMLSVIVGSLFMGYIFNIFAGYFPDNAFLTLPFYYQPVIGSMMFGAVYMATDPVTASQTTLGKYIYGFLIGVIAVIIRIANPAYPEGVMLAILFMNVMAPIIDHYIIQGNIKKRLNRAKTLQYA